MSLDKSTIIFLTRLEAKGGEFMALTPTELDQYLDTSDKTGERQHQRGPLQFFVFSLCLGKYRLLKVCELIQFNHLYDTV